MPPRLKNGDIIFKDHPEFRPNVTPSEIFKLGSFGGTYWRPINSSVTKKKYKDQDKEFPKSWWRGLDKSKLTSSEYDPSINLYGVKVGTTLEFWESKGWIVEQDPYGWVQWYCRFYRGRRTPDDKRQIRRWLGLAGPNGRFRNTLINLIKKNKTRYNDIKISPKIRQTLLHWGYKLTHAHYIK